jgi:hypothetical protein
MATKKKKGTENRYAAEFTAQLRRAPARNRDMLRHSDDRASSVKRALGKKFDRDEHGDAGGYLLWCLHGETFQKLQLLLKVPQKRVRACITAWLSVLEALEKPRAGTR